jgi:hypothetical protein
MLLYLQSKTDLLSRKRVSLIKMFNIYKVFPSIQIFQTGIFEHVFDENLLN